MKKINEDAVSPVVGVMLMVVVTVVVAAVVAMFASGFTTGTDTAPAAKLTYLGSVQGNNFEDGCTGEIGLLFEHEGGDRVVFTDMEFSLVENKRGLVNEVTFTMYDLNSSDVVSNSEAVPGSAILYPNSKISSDADKMTYRFKKIDSTIANGQKVQGQTVETGERFIVYVDEIIQNTASKYNTAVVHINRYGPGEAYYSDGEFEIGTGTIWSIKDTKSGKVIASGTLDGKVYERI